MKTYVNKTRTMKRLVLVTDKKSGKTETKFLGKGQEVTTSNEASFVEDGIKIRETASKQPASKKAETKEDKE